LKRERRESRVESVCLFERVYKEYKNAMTKYIAVRKKGLAECFFFEKRKRGFYFLFERAGLGLIKNSIERMSLKDCT
jgi:hypothetical protein